MNSRVQNM